MTETTPEKINELIDLLSDKTLSFGCEVLKQSYLGKNNVGKISGTTPTTIMVNFEKGFESVDIGELQFDSCPYKILGKDIMLGDVLAAMEKSTIEFNKNEVTELLDFWQPLGFDKSLQSIVDEEVVGRYYIKNRLRSPEARALCEILLDLFLKK